MGGSPTDLPHMHGMVDPMGESNLLRAPRQAIEAPGIINFENDYQYQEREHDAKIPLCSHWDDTSP